MPFRVVRNDITKMKTDAIVNTANPNPKVGLGSDANVYKAAGVDQLLAARKELGKIERGEAVFTEAFNLPAKYIIHTVGPHWIDGTQGEERILRNCYRNSLEIAYELGCKSIAFPLISTGIYGYPKEKALNVALSEINKFLLNTDFSEDDELDDMEVFLVVYNQEAFELSSKLYKDIQSYIDENYIEQNWENESLRNGKELKIIKCFDSFLENKEIIQPKFEKQSAKAEALLFERTASVLSLDEVLSSKEESFQDLLMRSIAEKNLSHKEVYKKANIDAKLFSKIICLPDYVPKKKTVMALAIGIGLSLSEAYHFMETAGFAFSKSNKIDLIVEYFISKQNYSMEELEETLYTLTGETLGNYFEGKKSDK